MSQAAPTFCMNVPMSETRSAINRLRKMGIRSGRQTLLDFSRSSLVAGLMSVGSCCPYKTSGADLATKDRATIHDQYRPKLSAEPWLCSTTLFRNQHMLRPNV